MPLHDWKDERGWDGMHLLWLAQLLDWIQPRLPAGFRAYVGSVPALTLEAANGKPDVTDLGLGEPATPPPHAISYRVGEPVPCEEEMGTQIALWRRRLEVGHPLPELPLPLDDVRAVVVDLEATYHAAARRVYLD